MRYPPVKTIEAVIKGVLDHRVRRSVTHFRHFFRAFNSKGEPTNEPDEIVKVEPTQRCLEYHRTLRQAA